MTLTVNGSVKISGNRGLGIVGQSTGDSAGRMVVNNPDGNAFERLSGTSDTAAINIYSGRLTAIGKDRALGENVYLYKRGSTNLPPIICEADGRQVRATASKTNPDEAYWSRNEGRSAFSAKSFTLQWCDHTDEEWEYVSVDGTNHYKIREWCNWRDGGAEGVEAHDLATKPTADGKGHSEKCQCGYGSDAVEDHVWGTDGITCTVCGFKKAAHTSNGNLYDDVSKALAAEPAGGTVTLEADVTAPITISSAVTLDLNGKSVTSLIVNHAAAKIKDSGGTKGTIKTLTAGTGVTIGSLCEDGYGFQSDDDNKWVAESATAASNVKIAEAPIKSVTINGRTDGAVTTTYGQSGVRLEGGYTEGINVTPVWYKVDNDSTATQVSSDAAYELPADLPVGTYTYRLTVTVDGYSKSCEVSVTVTPASLAGAEITVTNEDALVFSPDQSGQAATVTAQIKVELDGKELTAGTDYTVSGNEKTNAGTHTLTITGTGNYTGTKTIEWEIKKHMVGVPEIAEIIKTYDGTTGLPDGFVLGTFKSESSDQTGVTDVSLTAGKDYTMTGHYNSAEVGSGKAVRLQLTMNNSNYMFDNGQTTRDLVVDKTFYPHTPVVINQAAMPDFNNTMSLTVVNNLAADYTVKLPELPALTGDCQYGKVRYEITGHTLDSKYYKDGASVDANGVLTLPIRSVVTDTEGSIGTITVTVKTTNYTDAVLTVNVSAANKIAPQKQSIDVSTITYGEPLGKADFTAFTFVESGTSNQIAGTLAWQNPDKLLEAGTHEEGWVFTPERPVRWRLRLFPQK